jgi:hypothetical protein
MHAVLYRISRYMGDYIDTAYELYQEKAELLAKACDIDNEFYEVFTEEMIRGTVWFSVSQVQKKMEPMLRKLAKLGHW